MTALTVLCACNPITPDNTDPDKPNTEEPDKPGTEEPDKPGDEFQLPDVVKILAIGNSFSADAVEQELYGLFAAEGKGEMPGCQTGLSRSVGCEKRLHRSQVQLLQL